MPEVNKITIQIIPIDNTIVDAIDDTIIEGLELRPNGCSISMYPTNISLRMRNYNKRINKPKICETFTYPDEWKEYTLADLIPNPFYPQEEITYTDCNEFINELNSELVYMETYDDYEPE